MPQTGCDCSHCSAARKNPALARHVASLAIDVPETGHVYLVDATPDLPAQIEEIHGFRPHPEGKVDRAPVDGVLLTHAHIGHYLGLAHFGFESLNTQDIPAWVSPRMAAYLRTNGPWSQLVRLENIALSEIQPGQPFESGGGDHRSSRSRCRTGKSTATPWPFSSAARRRPCSTCRTPIAGRPGPAA